MHQAYLEFFHLNGAPFGETPNVRFFYESATHCDGLERLLASVRGGQGFSLLTGEVGTGKTLVTRMLLQSLSDTTDSALIFFPRCTEAELLRSICEDLNISEDLPSPASAKQDLDRLNRFLLENARRGRRTLLVIDEAQNLPLTTLETVRLLSNLESSERKLLHILLVGQPELRAMLARPELRQLRQRIGTDVHLTPFGADESADYIRFRLERAGGTNFVRFDDDTLAGLHRLTGGIPRELNRAAHGLLEFACEHGLRRITPRIFRVWRARAPGASWIRRCSAWLRGEAP